jgi:hypothetical protein
MPHHAKAVTLLAATGLALAAQAAFSQSFPRDRFVHRISVRVLHPSATTLVQSPRTRFAATAFRHREERQG